MQHSGWSSAGLAELAPAPVSPLSGNLYAMSNASLVNVGTAGNARLCGMVPLGVRQAHYFNYHGSGQSYAANSNGCMQRARVSIEHSPHPPPAPAAPPPPTLTGLGLPCPDELANGWQDLSEQL